MNSQSGKYGMFLGLILLGFIAACGSSTAETTDLTGDECETDQDCEPGICESGECVAWEFLENCSNDDECASGICIDTDEGGVCSQECTADDGCQSDGWRCQFDENAGGDICLPEPMIPPADGSTLCGAGGISEGEGYRLFHCFAPYDAAASTLSGDGVHLQSGGFHVITE